MVIMNNVLLFVRSSHARVQTNLMIFEVFGSRSNITRSNDIGPSGDEVKKTNWLSIVISSCTVNRGFSCTPDRNCHTFCLGDKIASHPGVLTQAKKIRKTLK